MVNEQRVHKSYSGVLLRFFVFGALIPFAASPQEKRVNRASDDQHVAITVQSDRACLFVIDGKSPRKVEAGAPTSMKVTRGEHTISAVTMDGKDSWETKWNADTDGLTIHISLRSVEAERLRKEAEAASLRQQVQHTREQLAKARERNRSFLAETQRLAKFNDPEAQRRVNDLRLRLIQSITDNESQYEKYAKLAGLWTDAGQSASNIARMNSGNPLGGVGAIIGNVMAAKDYDRATKDWLCAHAVMKSITWATNTLGASYQTGEINVDSKSYPEVFKVRTQSGSGYFTFTKNGIDYEEDTHVNTAKPRGPERLSVRCSEIRGIRAAGPPIIRDIDHLSDGTRFVLRAGSTNYTFEALSKEDRADIFGYLYLFCPSLN